MKGFGTLHLRWLKFKLLAKKVYYLYNLPIHIPRILHKPFLLFHFFFFQLIPNLYDIFTIRLSFIINLKLPATYIKCKLNLYFAINSFSSLNSFSPLTSSTSSVIDNYSIANFVLGELTSNLASIKHCTLAVILNSLVFRNSSEMVL
jgi:hypothetical protein